MADRDSRAGARYADPDILEYVERVHAAHDTGLAAAFAAPDREQMPAIQVGQSEGRLIEVLLHLVGARRVVEVGTLAGYSAIRCARAVGESGRVYTLEVDPKHAAVARANIDDAGFGGRVEVLLGEARTVLPTIEEHGPFDAVFIDADKENYDSYGRWAASNVRPGGLLLGDNAFLFGSLMADTPAARSMRRFHEEAARAFDTVCIPTPDGLLLGVKR
jgi:caffeoyl-CoA O-methyltransferase